MSPALEDGDVVEITPGPVQVGDIVVARHPFVRGTLLVKRVASVSAGGFDLRGDNPRESTDSRSLGLFRAERIVGVVRGRVLNREEPG